MSWFKVDDGFHSHPKALVAGTSSLGLWVRCGSWSAQHLTEGFVPSAIATLYGTTAMTTALVRSGLWVEVDGGYQMHDYLERNPTRDDVEAKRQAATERQRRARDRARMSQRESHRDSSVSHAPVTVPPTRPDPTPTSKETSSPSPRKRGTPPPDLFPITEAMASWGRSHCPNVHDPAQQTAQFLDHHRAKGSTFKDWTAAWRTWMSNAQRYAVRDGIEPVAAADDPSKAYLRESS